MPARLQKTKYPAELPPGECEGPQLQLFPYHDSPIQWRERLGADEEEDAGKEGYVFRTIIRRREYAIKVFKFFDPNSRKYFWGPLLGKDTPLDTVAYYSDPFYNECRAYGKIQELTKKKKLQPTIAVPCHGYLFLQERDEKVLRSRNFDFGLQHVDLNYQKKTVGGCRVRAIVKDITSENHGISKTNISKVLRGIRTLNRHEIYNGDIRLDNFRDGQLVDFGSSFTQPHAILAAVSSERAKDLRLIDLAQLDEMVEDEEIPVPKGFKALPQSDRVLRSHTGPKK